MRYRRCPVGRAGSRETVGPLVKNTASTADVRTVLRGRQDQDSERPAISDVRSVCQSTATCIGKLCFLCTSSRTGRRSYPVRFEESQDPPSQKSLGARNSVRVGPARLSPTCRVGGTVSCISVVARPGCGFASGAFIACCSGDGHHPKSIRIFSGSHKTSAALRVLCATVAGFF